MKTITITILILIIALTGCKATQTETCDYTPITQQNIDLVNQYNDCSKEKNTLQTDYNTLKDQNNQLKIDYLNQKVNNTCNNTDTSISCVSFINQIKRLDTRLEECYQMNMTFNCTESERDLNICEEKLENITDLID